MILIIYLFNQYIKEQLHNNTLCFPKVNFIHNKEKIMITHFFKSKISFKILMTHSKIIIHKNLLLLIVDDGEYY